MGCADPLWLDQAWSCCSTTSGAPIHRTTQGSWVDGDQTMPLLHSSTFMGLQRSELMHSLGLISVHQNCRHSCVYLQTCSTEPVTVMWRCVALLTVRWQRAAYSLCRESPDLGEMWIFMPLFSHKHQQVQQHQETLTHGHPSPQGEWERESHMSLHPRAMKGQKIRQLPSCPTQSRQWGASCRDKKVPTHAGPAFLAHSATADSNPPVFLSGNANGLPMDKVSSCISLQRPSLLLLVPLPNFTYSGWNSLYPG